MKSTITSKYQVTIPKQIRNKLKLSVSDTIEWRIEENEAVIKPLKKPILKYRGTVKTGPGDIREDIEAAVRARIADYERDPD